MKRFGQVLSVFAVAAMLSLAGLFAFRYLSRDACLDSGGVFDYVALICRTDVQTLPVGRLVDPLLASFLLAVSAICGAWGARLSSRRQ